MCSIWIREHLMHVEMQEAASVEHGHLRVMPLVVSVRNVGDLVVRRQDKRMLVVLALHTIDQFGCRTED